MLCVFVFFFFKQKTVYDMRISDWSSDVCSSDLPAAAYGGHQGPGSRLHPFLCAICVDRTVAEDQDDDPERQGAAAIARRARKAGRTLRVHPVRLLFDELPELLVEQRQVPWPRDPAPGLSLARRQPRRIYRRAAR